MKIAHRAYASLALAAVWLFASVAHAASPPSPRWTPRTGAANEKPSSAVAPGTAVAKAAAADPVGDTFNNQFPVVHDITRISADIFNNNVVVTLSFAGSISPLESGRPDALLGYVDFDTDGNTGETASNLATFCDPAQSPVIGTDFYVDLFGGSTSNAEIYNDQFVQVGTAATSFGSNSVTFTFPLSVIQPGAAPVRVASVIGPSQGPTDCAPNSTTLIASTATVGPAVQVTGTAQSGSTLTFRSPVSGVRYDWDFDGDGIFERSGSANALNVTYPGAYSGNVSVLTTDGNGNRTISNMALTTAAPRLSAVLNGTTATQVCGDNDGFADPGETYRVPIRVTNAGNASTAADASVAFSATDRVNAALAGQSIDGNLIVQTPLVDVGALAPNAFVDRDVTITIAQGAACGSTVGFQFTGGFDGVSSAPGSAQSINLTVPSSCNVFTGACPLLAQAKVDVVPRQGLYFNVNRPGNGLSNFVIQSPGQSPVFFGAWFTGGADRTPTWYVVQGNLQGNSVVAPIYRFTRDVGASTFTVNSTVVGTAVVALKSTELMAFFWQIGSKQGLELMTYLTPGPAASPNRTGAWYNVNEPGWGQVIHAFSQGGQNQIFAVDYIYDAAGEPRWVLTQASQAALASGGAGHLTYQVHCPGCPWISDWNTFPLGAGNGTGVFSSATAGTTTTSFTFPNPLAGNWVRTNLPIIILTNPQ